MIDVNAKYDVSKTVTTKFDRRFAVSPLQARTQSVVRQGADNSSSEDRPKTDAVAFEFGASKGGVEPMLYSATANSGAPTLNDVDVPEANGGGGCPAGTGDVSPGKDLAMRDSEALSISTYASAINDHWQRGVDAFLHIARLCAEASVRLTTAQKRELIQALPFGDPTFSKFVRIGTDTRLHMPEIKRLLPPHYTTTYAVTLLTDEELEQAIGDNVIYPDMKREELQRWRNSRRKLPRKIGLAPNPNEAESDSATASPPINPTKDAVENRVVPSVLSQRGVQENLEVQDELPLVAQRVAIEAVAAPLTLPLSDEDIPAFLDRRPLSAEDQHAYDVILAAWNGASAVVRERVRAEIINTSSRSAGN